jgi:hypothetical protein
MRMFDKYVCAKNLATHVFVLVLPDWQEILRQRAEYIQLHAPKGPRNRPSRTQQQHAIPNLNFFTQQVVLRLLHQMDQLRGRQDEWAKTEQTRLMVTMEELWRKDYLQRVQSLGWEETLKVDEVRHTNAHPRTTLSRMCSPLALFSLVAAISGSCFSSRLVSHS